MLIDYRKADFQRYIWISVVRFFIMFVEKLKQSPPANGINRAYWLVLNFTLSRNSRLALIYNLSELDSLILVKLC